MKDAVAKASAKENELRVVLYAYDMEPITVINLPHGAYEHLVKHGSVRLSVPTEPVTQAFQLVNQLEVVYKIVNISAELLRFRDVKSLMLFTHDEETALQLKSAFLPGQLGAVQDLQRNAFAYGFLTALKKLGEGNGY